MTDPLDYELLDKQLSITKTKVFLGKSAAFLAPLMCSMHFQWSTQINTAAVDGVTVWWNPHFFLRIPQTARLFVLVHELWHPGLLHMLRRGNRDPKRWNIAADIWINNMLDTEGYDHHGVGFKVYLDHRYDGWTTEAIYDDLVQNGTQRFEVMLPDGSGFGLDSPWSDDIVLPKSPEEAKQLQYTIVNRVVAAKHAAKAAGCGDIPGDVEAFLDQFLNPKLPWERLIQMFFNELKEQDYSWSRPNRRCQEVYLPSLLEVDEGLADIVAFYDVSGSVSDDEIIRYNSEMKHIWDVYQPAKMTIVEFDTKIQKSVVVENGESFDGIQVHGRGGTSLACVRDWIIHHKPSAVVVFSDLDCKPMQPLPFQLPMLWVAVNASNVTVPHGKIIHIEE